MLSNNGTRKTVYALLVLVLRYLASIEPVRQARNKNQTTLIYAETI